MPPCHCPLHNSTTPFDPTSAQAAIRQLLPQSADPEAQFTLAEIDKLFYWKIKLEVPLRSYLKTGLELAKVVAQETRGRLEEIYAKYDRNSDRKLRYIEFIEMLDDRKKKKAKWEVLALYDEAKSKGDLVEFDDFLYNLLLNPALKSFFDE